MAHSQGSARPVSRTIAISGRRVRLRMEASFWTSLEDIVAREGRSLEALCAAVDERRGSAPLSVALQVFVVSYFRAATPSAAPRAGLLDAAVAAVT